MVPIELEAPAMVEYLMFDNYRTEGDVPPNRLALNGAAITLLLPGVCRVK